MKRLICLLLALVMTLSMIPTTAMPAFAQEYLIQDETIPEETIPEETIPEETIPEETIPEETIPEETIPEETIPEETIPEETIPEETIPEETIPEETIPEEPLPEEPLPEETIPEETVPEGKIPTRADIDTTQTYSGTCGDNVTWTLTPDGTLTISGNGEMYVAGVYLPWYNYANRITNVVVEEGVTSLAAQAFYGLQYAQSVILPDSLTTIGPSAFYNCFRLTSITIPDSVTSIGNYAFKFCSSLNTVTLPQSITAIGKEAFYQCYDLSSIVLPEGLVSIGDSAFYCCTGLTSITLPESLTDVGEEAFGRCTGLTSANYPSALTTIPNVYKGCSGLTSLTIPEGVTALGYSAFAGCRGLTSITIPDGVTTIGRSVFSGCTGLTSIVIPESVTSIGSSAFYDCTGLTSITLPAGITKIESSLFRGCTGLTNLVIPDSVTSIEQTAFSGCSGLTSIAIPESVTSIDSSVFYGCTGLTSITIPEGITKIAYGVFQDCTGLTSVTISESVTNIGNAAFSGCTGLKEITLPSTLTKFGTNVFDGCTNLGKVTVHCNVPEAAFKNLKQLKEVVIGESVQSIGESAFQGCTGLEEITIPSSVTTIGASAFQGCTGLEELTIPANVTTIGVSAFNGCTGLTELIVPANVATVGESAFAYCTGLKTLTLSEGITSIKYRAFRGCTGLEEVTIPASVNSMGSEVFMGCTAVKKLTVNGLIGLHAFENSTSLEEVVFGDTATTIGKYAFNGCKNLTKVTFGNSLKTIQESAFENCTGLTEVDISSNKLTTIGSSAFRGCKNLTKVTLSDSLKTLDSAAFTDCTALESITVPAGVTAINENTFYNCYGLTEVKLPENLKTIGRSAFYNCYGLTEVQLPENLQTIGFEAFYTCYQLQDIQIPDTVTSIGARAFYGCESLLAIDLPEDLTTIGSEAFAFCISLLEVRIPEKVSSIGASAFNYCNNLITVTLPPRVERINTNAFAQCAELRHVLFTGTQTQWKEMYIAEGNDFLEDATRHYNAKGDEVTVVWDENGRSGNCTICSSDLDLSTLKIKGCIPTMEYEFTYTGSYIRPQITLFSTTYGILTEGVDYTLTFKNNKNVGTGKVTITGMGNFSGSMTQEFYIFPRQVQNVRVTDTTASSITYTYDKVPEADYYGIYQGSDMIARTSKTTYTLSRKNSDEPYESIEINIRALTKVGDYYYIGEPSEVIDAKAGFNLTKRGSATLEYTSVAYDGTAKEPSVTVKNSSKKTIGSKNYTVTYENNVNIGTATVTIKGIKECTGQKVKTFKIVPQQVAGVEVTELNYNCATITFQSVEGATEYWVYKDGDRVAKVEDTTYTFTGLSAGKTYKFSVRANTTIDGEDYTGKASETVSAKPFYTMEECSVTLKYDARAYTGKAVTNTATVKNPDGKTLKKDTDYKVSYENNVAMGVATMIITGKGKYAGQISVNYTIGPKQVEDVKLATLSGTSIRVTYDEMKGADEYVIRINGIVWDITTGTEYVIEGLKPGTKYTVTVSAGVLVDDAMIHGELSDSVSITPKHNMETCHIMLSQDAFAYTGSYQRPAVFVYNDLGEELTEGVDYTLSYKNNKNTGKAYVQLTGKGAYSGSVKEYFVINPAQVTGLKVSAATKNSVKISYTKASSNSTKYYNVYVNGEKVGRTASSSYTIKNLSLGEVYSVYVIGEKTVSGTAYYGEPCEPIEVWPGTYIGGYKATLEYTKATYTGEEFRPAVTVKTSSKSSAKTLVEGTDYIVTYENNVGPGKAKVIIQGIGSYAGTITKTVAINPPKVSNVTATAVSKTSIEVSFDAAPSATSYWVYVNGSRKAKITDTTCVITGLKKNKTYKITVKAVATVDSTNYTSDYTDAVSCRTPSK